MPTKPMKRRTRSARTREVASADSLAKLYDINRYDRNELTLAQINRIREIMDLQGFARAAEMIGVCQTTILKVTSGFGHKLALSTAEKIREFLGKK